jgi:integrase
LTDESTFGRRSKKDRRETKSSRGRLLPIHPDLGEALGYLKKHSDGLIFHGPLGGRLKPDKVRTTLIGEVLEPLKKRFPSPEDSGFASGRLHSFRHYFCSSCAASGVPERVVMQWLGHKDSKMVRHYFHLHDQEAQRQMRRMNFLRVKPGDVAGQS